MNILNSENIKNIGELTTNDTYDYGSKAVKMGLLMRKGFFVPNGFCINTSAFNKYFQNMEGFSDSKNYFNVESINLQSFVENHEISPSLISEIKVQIESHIHGEANSFAVRSSAMDEDSEDYSFAGLYKSFLHLETLSEIVEAIKLVWVSIWDDSAIHYRNKVFSNSELSVNFGMAVIVQEMVDAKMSGVCFTKNPLAQDNSCMIEFTQGTSEDLVEGNTFGSNVLVDRSSLKIHSTLSNSNIKENFNLKGIAMSAIQIEEIFGSPQDIEWCIDFQDRIWILQSRSITNKSINGKPGAKVYDWQLMYNEPFSTLGCDLAVTRHIAWVKAINEFYFISIKPKLMLKGSLIYNIEPLSETNWLTRLWLGIVNIVCLVNSRHVLNTYTRKILPKYKSLLNDIEESFTLAKSLDNLFHCLDKAIFIYIDSQIKSFAIGRVAQTALNVFSRYIRFIIGDKDSQDPLFYLNYTTYINPTIQRDIMLERILMQIKNYLSSELTNELSFPKLRQILQTNEKGKEHLKKLDNFLEKNSYIWADRYPRDPGWELDVKKLNSTMENVLQFTDEGNLSGKVQKKQSEAKQALKELENNHNRLSFWRLRLSIFKILLFKVNYLAAYKEQRNLFLYSVNMIIRNIALEIGGRLEIKGELLSQNDIFYLTKNEISNICSEEKLSIDLREKIQKRNNSFSEIKLNGIPKTGNFSSNRLNGIRKSNRFYGTGCSTGLAKGKVRILLSGDSLSSLERGEVAVCYNFRPAWSIILGQISGLVVEEANILSHGAILAREYGVPTVVNIPGVTELLKNGNNITLDGSSGLVKLLSN